MQRDIPEWRGRKLGKFRHNWTSSKALQGQLAAPSSSGLSESRDLSESETSIQTHMNFEKGQVQIGSSWTPDPDKRPSPGPREHLYTQAAHRLTSPFQGLHDFLPSY